MKNLYARVSIRKIWLSALVFCLALAVPAVVLIYTSYQQIKFESIHQQRLVAEDFADLLNAQLQDWLIEEERRTFADYHFLVVEGDESANFLQPSPLSSLVPASNMPGLFGYFQVSSNGEFSSPILPESLELGLNYGVSQPQYAERRGLSQRLRQILVENQLLTSEPASGAIRSDTSTEIIQLQSRSQLTDVAEVKKSKEQTEAESDALEEAEAESELAEPAVAQASQSSLALRSSDKKNDTNNTLNQAGFDLLLEEQKSNKVNVQTKTNGEMSDSPGSDLSSEKLDEVLISGSRARQKKTEAPRLNRTEQLQLPEQKKSAGSRLFDTEVADLVAEVPSPITVENTPDTLPVEISSDSSANVLPTITLFESDVEPMEFARLGDNYWVFFRKVWRDGERIIQGGLIEGEAFIKSVFADPFYTSRISNDMSMEVFSNGIEITRFQFQSENRFDRTYDSISQAKLTAPETDFQLLLQRYLSPPFGSVELRVFSKDLPLGPGGQVITWAGFIMAMVLLVGGYMFVRLGSKQLLLAQQQQDFVSAVSHELKTPLTSIRMYGEMLREGWVNEEKRAEYYDYIYDESERLSRLISNVLQLSRMSRDELGLSLKPVSVGELIDNIQSKLQQQVVSAGFELVIQCDEDLRLHEVLIDADAFMQVLINLTDNAIKFSRKAEAKKVILSATVGQSKSQKPISSNESVIFSIRDFGPGIDKSQLKKIFSLFYRAESELTRETVGTGIGLALVHQLVRAMGGTVDVVNLEPGAEFRVNLSRHLGSA